MKAKDLAKKLLEFPELEVILASDPEGNNFSPYSDHSPPQKYIPETMRSGEVLNLEDYQERVDAGETPEDAIDCIILWPKG